jgi:hypothetical protein
MDVRVSSEMRGSLIRCTDWSQVASRFGSTVRR